MGSTYQTIAEELLMTAGSLEGNNVPEGNQTDITNQMKRAI